ncbi:MAG: transcription antitermination protein NusB [Alistipes sp.]|uniref:transcription antitermination protein NusB n=1 Tax=Alistipes sp. TaxID=1872444 RepID=UPI001B70C692|nr:transcription antitermination protein NusB [Alistipes sp.]
MLSRRLLRIKVAKNLYAHLKSGSDNLKASEKNLVESIDKAYDLYFQMMSLIVEVARYAETRIELNKNKKLPTYEDLNPNRRFVDNAVIHLIATSDSVNDVLASRKLTWAKHSDAVKDVYNRMVESEYYKKYMSASICTFSDDRRFVEEFFTAIEEDDALADVVNDMSLLWTDDYGFALYMAVRTVQNLKQSHTEVKVLPKFKSDEDLDFARTLLIKTLVNFEDHQEIVDRYSSNWDVERVVYMDSLILALAITELTYFESIPVKVTLDEWIEIAKYYSSPTSSTFVNGVLDRVIADFTSEGRIKKSGRGLL